MMLGHEAVGSSSTSTSPTSASPTSAPPTSASPSSTSPTATPTPVVASTQRIELSGHADGFDARAEPDALLRMLQDYFAVAGRCAAGLVRVRWRADRPRFTLIWPPLTLIAMAAPRYTSDPDRRAVSLDVLGGWLVDPRAAPRLAIAITRESGSLVASVELRDYAPRGVRLAVVRWLYLQTQARVHAWVGLSYLRQLRRQWLAARPA
jgi:hypothetical protein